MIPVRVRVFKGTNDKWEDMCMGMVFRIRRGSIFIEDDVSGRPFEISFEEKQCGKSKENVVIVYNDLEEHAICFEAEEIRDEFLEFVEKDLWSQSDLDVREECTASGRETNLFASLFRISRYMDASIFGRMLESRDGVLQLLRMENFHLFRMLLENGERVFRLFGVASKNKITPHGFYAEIIARNLDGPAVRTYEDFLIAMGKQELARSESKVAGMSNEEIRDFLRKCGSSSYKVGRVEMYLERIYKDDVYFFEMFYYLCLIFKERMSEAVDIGYIVCRIRGLTNEKYFSDDFLYALEGLYILLDVCKPEQLDVFYMEISSLFDNLEWYPDLQNFLVYLFGNHGFRTREFLINTGLMKRIFLSGCGGGMGEVFLSKMLLQVVSCGSRFMHRYFIKNDLFRNIAEMYRGRRKDAVYSIFLQACSHADSDMKTYLDRHLQN
ncbi:hypothetical protein J0A71_04g09110 [Encephalitozoon cuniculi]|nr:hypothetical protein J0A71_04g09110 [Encephalitozoon cuniculi]